MGLRIIKGGKKIGVDAGSSSVKVVEITKTSDGVELASWSLMPFRVPPNAAPEAARQVQAQAIDAAIKKSDCKCRDVVVGVPGNSAFIRNIKLPPIPSSKIDQIVRYEIQQTIPFPIENIALDYQMLEPDESSEVEVIMVAMKGEVAEGFIRDIEQAKVNVGIVDSIPLALYNCYMYNGYSSKEDCTAIIEIGASTSNILVELGGELRYCRAVSVGGNDITNALAKEFKIPTEQAERIKIQHGLIFPESQEANFTQDQVRVSKTIASVLDRLMGEVKLTIGYFRSLTGATAISRAILSGGCAMMRNLKPFLADRLGVQVEILNPFKKVGVPKNLINVRKVAPIFSTAVGLALRSTQECCQLKISLVPPKIKAEKQRRLNVVCNIASGALLAGIVVLLLWRAIPDFRNRAQRMAALDQEIAKYGKLEEQLLALKEQKGLLLGEYNLYNEYPSKGVDPLTPLVMLADALMKEAWVRSVRIEEGTVIIAGAIKSDTKVEELKQLSKVRLELEKYCKEVEVKTQEAGTEGLNFELELKGVPNIKKYFSMREALAKGIVVPKEETKKKGS